MRLRTYTPLRYPGGKVKIYDSVKKLIQTNYPNPPTYSEVFAGGSGLALKLLLTGVVSEIHINDLDDAIYSFWYSILNNTTEIIELINNTDITIENWYIQKEIYENPTNYSTLSKGFSTLFLNRTNRSGIMKAGPIGGKSQKGNYKIDCRFNKKNIITLIQNISMFKDNIYIYNLEANSFLDIINTNLNDSFIYLDPPYVAKGPELYKNSFAILDHRLLRDKVATMRNKWYITYDDHSVIEELYSNYRIDKFKLNYSVSTAKIGTEISIYSNNLLVEL